MVHLATNYQLYFEVFEFISLTPSPLRALDRHWFVLLPILIATWHVFLRTRQSSNLQRWNLKASATRNNRPSQYFNQKTARKDKPNTACNERLYWKKPS
jgi:hypothetical protein